MKQKEMIFECRENWRLRINRERERERGGGCWHGRESMTEGHYEREHEEKEVGEGETHGEKETDTKFIVFIV